MRTCKIFICIILVGCQNTIKYPEGGFDYPKHVNDEDSNFYYYPLKNIESRKDSFRDADGYLFFKPFNEPNLSIKSQAEETFRFTCGGALGESTIIVLTEELITLKTGSPSSIYETDELRLNELERDHLNILNRWFPIDTAGKKPYQKHYLDSLTKLYPQLHDPKYYRSLIDKTILPERKAFKYKTTEVSIKKEQYKYLIEEINSSGYWSLPFRIDCIDPPMDGYSFTLEANTKRKYKIVSVGGCPDDTSRFTKACQNIIDYAKMKNEINLIWKGEVTTQDMPLQNVHEP